MEIKSLDEPKAVTVSVSGNLDATTAPEFEKVLVEQIERYAKPLVVNLEGVEYISSAGLRAILSVGKRMKSIEKRILLSGLRGAVKKVFEISGFYSIFEICETKGAALEQI